MTPEQKAAFIFAQSISAMAEIEAMKAANAQRDRDGYAQAYGEESFASVPAQYGIHYNQIVEMFRD